MTKKEEPTDQFFCSFCGKNQKEVKKLIAGPSVYICNECIQLCSEILEDEEKESLKRVKSPRSLGCPKKSGACLHSHGIEPGQGQKGGCPFAGLKSFKTRRAPGNSKKPGG